MGLADAQLPGRLTGSFDYIHFFTTSQCALRAKLPKLKRHLSATGAVWISWPKARGLGADLTLKDVIRLAYDAGFVESKAVAFDDVWSAIKLTHPKPGKVYRNSYGRLPATS